MTTRAVFKTPLYNAVNTCDLMILQADRDNETERLDHRNDLNRLARHTARRATLVAHRCQLESLYVLMFNENPWHNVPF